jgi:hypothetical protein
MPHDRKAFQSNGHPARPADDAGGLSPLEVLLAVMRRYYQAGEWDSAARVAKDAAPYVHPRLSAACEAGGPGAQVKLSSQ